MRSENDANSKGKKNNKWGLWLPSIETISPAGYMIFKIGKETQTVTLIDLKDLMTSQKLINFDTGSFMRKLHINNNLDAVSALLFA